MHIFYFCVTQDGHLWIGSDHNNWSMRPQKVKKKSRSTCHTSTVGLRYAVLETRCIRAVLGSHLPFHCKKCNRSPELQKTKIKRCSAVTAGEIAEAFSIEQKRKMCVSEPSLSIYTKEFAFIDKFFDVCCNEMLVMMLCFCVFFLYIA